MIERINGWGLKWNLMKMKMRCEVEILISD
jgi:hypothetical protein